MKKLEKEANGWKNRFDGCNKALVDMVSEVSESALINVICSWTR